MNKILDEAAKIKFLELFPQNYQSHISNIFLEAIRKGSGDTPATIALYVKAKAITGLQEAREYNDAHNTAKFKLLNEILTEHLETALEYATYCLEWERLPRSLKDRIKAERATHYRKIWYEQKRGGA